MQKSHGGIGALQDLTSAAPYSLDCVSSLSATLALHPFSILSYTFSSLRWNVHSIHFLGTWSSCPHFLFFLLIPQNSTFPQNSSILVSSWFCCPPSVFLGHTLFLSSHFSLVKIVHPSPPWSLVLTRWIHHQTLFIREDPASHIIPQWVVLKRLSIYWMKVWEEKRKTFIYSLTLHIHYQKNSLAYVSIYI
jgi:hypothetical protein